MAKWRLSSRRFQLILVTRVRRAFAANLDLTDAHKVKIYEQLCASVSLRDISYWLEVILAAGIATLGLVLNSPAVIIGAMLISPLMGTILANGLGLATGDIVLWLRAAFNLLLSCVVAIAFAMILVWLVPFKEMTTEIMARTQPTLLDLIVALFSGAVGSVATCKQVKGVAASLPGVAIAVALMPPLCVVGYGIGIYLSLNAAQGLVVAKGGGLLFITNLVAIIFTAMIVFFFVQFDTHAVQEQVDVWKKRDLESRFVASWLNRLPHPSRFRRLGGLPGRFLIILATMGAIALPLHQSLKQLRQQVAQQQETNQLRSAIQQVWQETMGSPDPNQAASYIDQINITQDNQTLNVQLLVVTDTLLSRAEQETFTQQLATSLKRAPSTLNIRFIQIPTSQMVDAQPAPLPTTPTIASISDLQQQLMTSIDQALVNINFPDDFPLVAYQLILRDNSAPFTLSVVYLGDRDLQTDAELILSEQIQDALQDDSLSIHYQRIARQQGRLSLADIKPKTDLNSDTTPFSPPAIKTLDKLGKLLQTYPHLTLQLTIENNAESNPGVLLAQTEAIRQYWAKQWQIADNRIAEVTKTGDTTQFLFTLTINNPTNPLPSPSPISSPQSNPYERGIY